MVKALRHPTIACLWQVFPVSASEFVKHHGREGAGETVVDRLETIARTHCLAAQERESTSVLLLRESLFKKAW